MDRHRLLARRPVTARPAVGVAVMRMEETAPSHFRRHFLIGCGCRTSAGPLRIPRVLRVAVGPSAPGQGRVRRDRTHPYELSPGRDGPSRDQAGPVGPRIAWPGAGRPLAALL